MTLSLQFALLFIFVAAVSATPVDKCQIGPSYWCQTTTRAVECGKELYCSRKLMGSQPPPPRNDALCNVCKISAIEVGKFVNRNNTEGEVKAAIIEVCHDNPLYQDVCDDILGNWTQTWNQVKNVLKNDSVCYEEGTCNGPSLQADVMMNIMRQNHLKVIKMAGRMPMGDALCTLCVDLATFLYNWTLNDTVRDMFHEAVIEECKSKPDEPECKKVLTDFNKYWKDNVVAQLYQGKECYGYEQVCSGGQPSSRPSPTAYKQVMGRKKN